MTNDWQNSIIYLYKYYRGRQKPFRGDSANNTPPNYLYMSHTNYFIATNLGKIIKSSPPHLVPHAINASKSIFGGWWYPYK